MLFIASGAFHAVKVSDLLPELQVKNQKKINEIEFKNFKKKKKH